LGRGNGVSRIGRTGAPRFYAQPGIRCAASVTQVDGDDSAAKYFDAK
jgi:hypothetical protein